MNGPYRYVRHPIHVAVVAALCGQGLLVARSVLFAYAAGTWVLIWAFVRRTRSRGWRAGSAPSTGSTGGRYRPGGRGACTGGAPEGAAAGRRDRSRNTLAVGLGAPWRSTAAWRGNSPCTGLGGRRHAWCDTSHQYVTWVLLKPVVFRRSPGRPPTGQPGERHRAR
ncbi:hypothetical protein ACIRU3_20285 [Streptomyces sp. NPDC101151]|uniref:hypothetical protein n=1 Tax=Streptomyces sp. NPDC101151 TaxID=3366115 RepID=UPI0037F7CA6C